MLRRIFEPKRNVMKGSWKNLRNEELHDLHSSQCIIRMIKSRRMKGAEHVEGMREKRYGYRLLARKQRERNH
jgi:hypothetical protein